MNLVSQTVLETRRAIIFARGSSNPCTPSKVLVSLGTCMDVSTSGRIRFAPFWSFHTSVPIGSRVSPVRTVLNISSELSTGRNEYPCRRPTPIREPSRSGWEGGRFATPSAQRAWCGSNPSPHLVVIRCSGWSVKPHYFNSLCFLFSFLTAIQWAEAAAAAAVEIAYGLALGSR